MTQWRLLVVFRNEPGAVFFKLVQPRPVYLARAVLVIVLKTAKIDKRVQLLPYTTGITVIGIVKEVVRLRPLVSFRQAMDLRCNNTL